MKTHELRPVQRVGGDDELPTAREDALRLDRTTHLVPSKLKAAPVGRVLLLQCVDLLTLLRVICADLIDERLHRIVRHVTLWVWVVVPVILGEADERVPRPRLRVR